MEKSEATFAELMANCIINRVFPVEHKKKRKARHDTNNLGDFARIVNAEYSQRERESNGVG